MYVIAGLGNPGKKYEKTRHNIGFITIDQLAEKHNINVDKLKFKALVGEGRISDQKIVLIKPQTFMNLSGESIQEVMNFYKLPPENLIVIYDDIDIELGTLRIRKSGSAGTHNGMRSIVQHLNSQGFPRIRIGMGGPQKGNLVDFVIGGFTKDEEKVLYDTVSTAIKAIECIVESGTDLAMNKYNIRKRPKKEDE